MSFISILPLITLYNPTQYAQGANQYTYWSEMDTVFNLPVAQDGVSNTWLTVRMTHNEVGYNNINSYNVGYPKSDTINVEGQSFDVEFHCNNTTYNTSFVYDGRVGSNWFRLTNDNPVLHIDYSVELDGGGVILLRFYTGSSYSTSTDRVGYYSPVPHGWYDDYIENTILDGIEIYNTTVIDFSNSDLYNSLSSQISYQMSYYGDGNGAYDYGYDKGKEDGYWIGYDEGYDTGYEYGDSVGYQRGFSEGFSADTTALTIFSGILAIGTLPINIFLSFFNFEVLGINFSELVSSMLSVCVCLIIIKKVFATDTGD